MNDTVVIVVVALAVAGMATAYWLSHRPVAHKQWWDVVDDIGVSGNKYVGSSAAKILGAIGL